MNSLRKKEADFAILVGDAKACALCPRMAQSTRVIGYASGKLDSNIFIIGEAPGRLGADASAIPFHGDKAGENFESLLEQVGLSRNECFVTNAALCNPKDENGNNATPTQGELQNCSGHLKRQLDLIEPVIVVTLGAQALRAIKSIEDHTIDLAVGVRKKWSWYGRILVPLYHPGQRAMVHRSFFNQLADYKFLAETYARCLKGNNRIGTDGSPTTATVTSIAARLIAKSGALSYFALHKLFYLTEYEYFRRKGSRATSAYIVRQKEGPYTFELHIKKLKKAINGLNIWTQDDRLMLGGTSQLFDDDGLQQEMREIIDYVITKYGVADDSELKRVVYLTAPMRAILRREKGKRENLFNRPLDFSAIQSLARRAAALP